MKSDKVSRTDLCNLKFELLVPAGNMNTAITAVDYGADAVYMGYAKFGARSAAGNSFEDLAQTVEYAHRFGVRVYVTVNTILTDDELIKVEKLLHKLALIKVDAVIIQDFGILKLNLPKIRLHASTQCHNNTIEKIKFLEETGFKRVILPRETTLEEIRKIKSETKIELESFIHGALCVSYSGQCYLSRVIGGRSANRGECAQPCRKTYSLYDQNGNCLIKNKYLLSLKDFNLSNRLEELVTAGITSFKIEGRLKNEAYVKNVTAFYRRKLDEILEKYSLKRLSEGENYYDFTPDLNKTFNRGFCEFNIDGVKKKIATLDYTSSPGEFVGTVKTVGRGYFVLNKDFSFSNGDGICFYSDGILTGTNINKTEGNRVFPADLKNIKQGLKIYRNFDKNFDDKLKNSKTQRKINIKIRVREVDFAYILFADDERGNTSCEVLPKIYEPAKIGEKSLNAIETQLKKTGKTEFEVKECDIKLKNIPFIKISEINEIRRNLMQKLRLIREKNYILPEPCENIKIVQYPSKEVDYRANVYNSKSKEFYEECGCIVKENALEGQNDLKNREVMISKYCIRYETGMCLKEKDEKDNRKLFLRDEYGKEYALEFDCANCLMKIKTRNFNKEITV